MRVGLGTRVRVRVGRKDTVEIKMRVMGGSSVGVRMREYGLG